MSTATKPELNIVAESQTGTTNTNSQRIYINGTQPGVRVPFREISQNRTRNFDGTIEDNAPVRVYDTSGPWGDPSRSCDVRAGLPTLRRHWILERGDVEEYNGREHQTNR